MNKTELIAEVAKKCGMSKKDAEKAVSATFDTITEVLCAGDKVQLVGFGGFETKAREARMGRNPKTKDPSKFPRPPFPSSSPARRSRTRSASNTPSGRLRSFPDFLLMNHRRCKLCVWINI